MSELRKRKYELEEKIEKFYDDITDEVLYGTLAVYYDKLYEELEEELNEVNEEIKYNDFYKKTEL